MHRRHAISGIFIVGVLVATTTLATAAAQRAGDADEEAPVTSFFRVEGMTCGGCEVAVETVVNKLEGVEKVDASYREGQATVTYDEAKVTPAQIIEAIEKLGYKAELVEEPQDT